MAIREKDRDAYESYKENITDIKKRLTQKQQQERDLSLRNYNATFEQKDDQFSDKKSQMSKT